MLVWAPISPASVPHKSDELPRMPPLFAINPPLLFLPSYPPFFCTSWRSDQLNPCPALTVRQHFLSHSYPLALSFFSSFWLSGRPLSTQRHREETKGDRKQDNPLFLGCEMLCTEVSEYLGVSMCWKENILLQSPRQEVYFPPATWVLRGSERKQKMKRGVEIIVQLSQFTV